MHLDHTRGIAMQGMQWVGRAHLGNEDGGAQGRREEFTDGGARLRAELQAEALAGARHRLQRLLHQCLCLPPLL